ncbi:hypothetical protein LguiA_029595 [Lonicera macranthoides]
MLAIEFCFDNSHISHPDYLNNFEIPKVPEWRDSLTSVAIAQSDFHQVAKC